MKKFLIGFLVILVLIILDGFYVNPKELKIAENGIKLENLPESFDGFKIAQFSDFLLGTSKGVEDLKAIVKKINSFKPDIVVFTGDLISSDYKPSDKEIKELKKHLADINPNLYKYTSVGDNDTKQIELFQEIMKESDFIILDNESTHLFYKDNKPLKITGLTNNEDIKKAIETTEVFDTAANMIITHYPDYIDAIANENVQFVLSGHSLKGQIRIPFIGGIIKKDNAQNYLDDYYVVNNTKLFISGGLGTEGFRFRLFNKPEINFYRLNAK